MPLPTRWQWKLRYYQNKIDRWKESLDDLFKASKAKTRICPSCHALVGADVSRCPFCDAHITAFQRVGVQRVTGSVMPDITDSHALIALNFVLFAICLVSASKMGQGLEAMAGMPRNTLIMLGSNFAPFVHYYHQYWRLLSYAFLHGNMLHLLLNMYAMLVLCPLAEELYGWARFIVAYVFTAVCGGLASYMFLASNSVGASGAIFGMLGLLLGYGMRRGGSFGATIRGMAGQWIIWGVVTSFIPGTDWAAHFGGMAGGFLFGLLVGEPQRGARDGFWKVMGYGAWMAIAACFGIVGLGLARLQ